jgi:UDP-N-acetylglucosamine 2-epimerase (non-hydrolysing)
MVHILHVVGARPNFMKVAPVLRSLSARPGIRQTLVHTGQHYDRNMSDVFFEQLGMPEPDVNLKVGSSSHAQQTAAIMSRFEPVLLDLKPDLTLVYGDVNSTVAVTLVCSKLGFKIGHVEAGLRSFDRTMPEELNRIVTDQLSDLLFTPSSDGDENLSREGISKEKIFRVGNVMIDTLVRLLPLVQERFPILQSRFGLQRYGLVTLHRPSNVDDRDELEKICTALDQIAEVLPLLFPIHPRTLGNLGSSADRLTRRLILTEPLAYMDFLALQQHAAVVITDSGGIQEETTYLGVPCVTVRENTERPVTITCGTNVLIGRDMGHMCQEVDRILRRPNLDHSIPPLWDGRASERIADVVTGKVLGRSYAAAH